MPSCQLCGSSVSINGAEATCPSCGAEYDVIRHGRRGDFSRSLDVVVNAQKMPTKAVLALYDDANINNVASGTLFVGTIITIRVWLYEVYADGTMGSIAKPVDIYRRIDTGVAEKIATVTTIKTSPWYVTSKYTLGTAGKHTFYAEFVGDATHAGCPSKIDGLTVEAQEYSVSPEVSVNAQPALTVVVKDMIFKKPIVGARVVVDTVEAVTDASGMAVFDALALGAYTLTVSAKDYKSEKRTVELTTLGMVVEVHLIHVAAIALGIVGGAGVGLIVVHKALKRK